MGCISSLALRGLHSHFASAHVIIVLGPTILSFLRVAERVRGDLFGFLGGSGLRGLFYYSLNELGAYLMI